MPGCLYPIFWSSSHVSAHCVFCAKDEVKNDGRVCLIVAFKWLVCFKHTSLNFLNYTQLIINWADIIKRERGIWQLLGRHSVFDTYLLFVLLLFLEVVVPIPVAAVWGVGLQPLTCWDWGFESRWGHGCLSVVNIVCCQVEVSASGWSLVQRSVIDCGLSVIMYPR